MDLATKAAGGEVGGKEFSPLNGDNPLKTLVPA
jgi:hypothetical protein